MNLNNLKYFVDSARLGSMTKSAELNHLSRPAISQAIQKLEEEIGVQLIVHKRRSFELTQDGMTLLKKSESLFLHVDEIKQQLKASRGPWQGEFRIGTARTVAAFSLPPIIAKLRRAFPSADFKFQFANANDLMQMLDDKKIDVAFFVGDDFLSGSKHVVIHRGHFSLIQPKNIDGHHVQYAITEKRPETERLRTIYEREFNKPLPVFAEVQSWDTIWTWVQNGICGGLVPDFMFESKKNSVPNLKVVLPKIFPYEIKVLYRKSSADNLLIKSLLELLK